MNQLELVQNSATYIIIKMRKSDDISKVRRDLHRLRVQQRIDFSVLTDVYKVFHGLGPPFISELISLSEPGRFTRASNCPSLAYHVKVPGNNYGEQQFVYAVAALWNKLPCLDPQNGRKTLENNFKHTYSNILMTCNFSLSSTYRH